MIFLNRLGMKKDNKTEMKRSRNQNHRETALKITRGLVFFVESLERHFPCDLTIAMSMFNNLLNLVFILAEVGYNWDLGISKTIKIHPSLKETCAQALCFYCKYHPL